MRNGVQLGCFRCRLMGLAIVPLLLHLLARRVEGFAVGPPAIWSNNRPVLVMRRRSFSARGSLESDDDDSQSSDLLTPTVVEALDLDKILQQVAAHAGTRRGRRAVMNTIKAAQKQEQSTLQRDSSQRKAWLSKGGVKASSSMPPPFTMPLASTVQEARHLYDLLDQAMLGLHAVNNATFPPIYSPDSGPWDTSGSEDTDDDEWLGYGAVDDFELQDILKAEQVVKRLINVANWASQEPTVQWMPLLAEIVSRSMDRHSLQSLYETLQDSVQIVRVRSALDVHAKSSFLFRLNDAVFPALSELRKKEADAKMNKEMKKSIRDKEIETFQDAIAVKEREIKESLVYSILAFADIVNEALDCVAELDTVFAKAAFALQTGGRVPMISSEGKIDVSGFVHPLLFASKTTNPVPVDLTLASRSGSRALIISGSNGGGKTLCLKSFGVVAVMARLGVAIPTTDSSTTTRVDFFHELLAAVGDRQDLLRGASTYAAQLQTYSQCIVRVTKARDDDSILILLDELGGGTEGNAGGAIAQAILEKLLANRTCSVVATTHSARLKSLSFEDENYECASVLVSEARDNLPQPTYQLQYGIIGESNALSAASRCSPSLPDGVLSRASDLLFRDSGAGNDDSGDASATFMQVMSKSLEHQLEMASGARRTAETAARNQATCQRTMLSLADAYERHFQLLDDRVHQCYQTLKADKAGALDVLGATLEEIRVAKKEVKSTVYALRERGLKLLPMDYVLREGESVVVVCDGEWDGTMATVAPGSSLAGVGHVLVIPSWNPTDDTMRSPEAVFKQCEPVAFPRYQLAIWDYDSVWQSPNFDADSDRSTRVTSVPEARRRMSSILASLSTVDDVPQTSKVRSGSSTQIPTYKSSRLRKALTKAKGKIKKK